MNVRQTFVLKRQAALLWKTTARYFVGLTLGFVAIAASTASAELSNGELAKLSQNPISPNISLPFQNNIDFNTGPREKTKNVLNIQPIIPFGGYGDWKIVTRTVLPVITEPGAVSGQETKTGLGDMQFNVFLSPAQQQGLIWRMGAVMQLPTHTDQGLGNDNWGLGPSLVAIHLDKNDPWVYGLVVNNIWSVSDSKPGGSYNNGLIQPIINYNFPGGTYLTSSMMNTVNWKAERSQRWTVPLGGGIGHIFHIGKQPVNTQLSAYYNVIRPDDAPNWQLRIQVQFLFPE